MLYTFTCSQARRRSEERALAEESRQSPADALQNPKAPPTVRPPYVRLKLLMDMLPRAEASERRMLLLRA